MTDSRHSTAPPWNEVVESISSDLCLIEPRVDSFPASLDIFYPESVSEETRHIQDSASGPQLVSEQRRLSGRISHHGPSSNNEALFPWSELPFFSGDSDKDEVQTELGSDRGEGVDEYYYDTFVAGGGEDEETEMTETDYDAEDKICDVIFSPSSALISLVTESPLEDDLRLESRTRRINRSGPPHSGLPSWLVCLLRCENQLHRAHNLQSGMLRFRTES
ncbi:unnamed protein product, partial [Protopolystoma xenopodis]